MTTRDVHSLLHWAPRSRAVIVCGELAGIGEATIKRLVRQRAPDVEVIGADMPVNRHEPIEGDHRPGRSRPKSALAVDALALA